jgi:hypothetical protein
VEWGMKNPSTFVLKVDLPLEEMSPRFPHRHRHIYLSAT